MIRNDSELKETLRRIELQKSCDAEYQKSFANLGLSPAEIEVAMGPTMLLRSQMEHDVEAYNKLKRGDLGGPRSISDLGRFLVEARIARGLSLRELAKRLGVDESSVSRDERNEYHGITLERACRILESLNVEASLIGKVRSVANATKVYSLDFACDNYSISSSSTPDVHFTPVSKKSVRSVDDSPGFPADPLPSLSGAA